VISRRWLRPGANAVGLATGIADQAASALSNIVIIVAIARKGGPASLGEFAYAFAIYIVFLVGTRGLVTDGLASMPRSGTAENRRVESLAVSASLLIAIVGGLLVASFGLVLGQLPLVVVGVLMPALIVQDAGRYVAFRRRQPAVALASDVAWLSLVLGLFLLPDGLPAAAYAVAWAASAGFAGLVSIVWLRVRFRAPLVVFMWWRSTISGFGLRAATDSLAAASIVLIAVVLLGRYAGDEDVGVLRASQSLAGPVSVAVTAVCAFTVPRVADSPHRFRRYNSHSLAAILLMAAAVFMAVPVWLAPTISQALLQSPALSRSLMFWTATWVGLVSASAAYLIYLKGRRLASALLRVRVFSITTTLPLLWLAATAESAVLVAAALSVQGLAQLLGLAITVHRHGRADEGSRERLNVRIASVSGHHP
jgi:O-antigen/teichoic acid export membrane protein